MERNTSGKARTWLVTWNNPVVTDWDQLVELAQPVKFMTGQLERGKEGTNHWQFVMHFSSPRAFTAIRKQFPLCHLEIARVITRAVNYCRKTDSRVEGPWTFGDQPLGGSGSAQTENWDEWYELAKQGRISEIPPQIQIKYFANLDKIRCRNIIKVDQPNVRGVWICGLPGVGKSHWVRKVLADDSYYPKPANKWWDGYTGQDYVVLEDLDHDTAKFMPHHLKIWADKWSFVAEAKGTAAFPCNRWFVATSNYTMQELFGNLDSALQNALYRRFHRYTMVDRDTFVDQDSDKVTAMDLAKDFREFFHDDETFTP